MLWNKKFYTLLLYTAAMLGWIGTNTGISSSTFAQTPPLSNPSSLPPQTSVPEIRFDIDGNGRPFNISITQSSGNQQLDEYALGVVQQWQFPFSQGNQTGVTATINLNLIESATSSDSTSPTATTSRYPELLVKSFMEGCTKNESEREAACGCMIDYFQANVPLERFFELIEENELPPELINAASVSCIQEILPLVEEGL